MEQDNPSEAAIQVPNGQNKIMRSDSDIARDVESKSSLAPSRGQKRRRRSAMQIFKVALFMMRSRSEKPKAFPVSDGTTISMWNKLIGSVRPLQLQHRTDSSSPSPSSSPSLQLESPPVLTLESSPAHDSEFGDDTLLSPSASSCASDSRYASAVGLNEMVVQVEEEEEEEESKCEGEGDTMIDAKAEEFIANFYQQMKLQRMNSMDYYREIRERSLG